MLFVKQTAHENIKNITAHYGKQFLFTTAFSKVPQQAKFVINNNKNLKVYAAKKCLGMSKVF